MPPKFPIDYQPGKVQAFLISKETGRMIEATPLTEIAPKPWPIDDIETETEPEPPKSLTLSGTFTLKTKMKANQRRKLIRAFSGKQKLPRKLKKALKHVGFFVSLNSANTMEDGKTDAIIALSLKEWKSLAISSTILNDWKEVPNDRQTENQSRG